VGTQIALLTGFNLKNCAIVYIRLLFDNFKLASFKLISVMKKKIKKCKSRCSRLLHFIFTSSTFCRCTQVKRSCLLWEVTIPFDR